jgi:hypothetical protein
MTATAHAVIGTVIAAKVGNPALAIPLALASHVAADAFPHWDIATRREDKTWNQLFSQTVIDVMLGFALSYIIIYLFFPATSVAYAYLIVVMAQLFDWLMAPYYFFKIKLFKPFYKFQKLFDNKMDKPWGIAGQIAAVAGLVLLAKVI